jgi:hypothetical protein
MPLMQLNLTKVVPDQLVLFVLDILMRIPLQIPLIYLVDERDVDTLVPSVSLK